MKKMFIIILCLISNQISAYKNFVLISAPGSGKGTFSQYCIDTYGYVQICPGDIFRNEIKKQTELGKHIQPIVDRGDYVDESIVCKLIEENISIALKDNKNFIIDGFPRSDVSFEFLYNYFKDKNILTNVCFLQLVTPDTECINRILDRQICTNCFKVYNATTMKSSHDTQCESCGTILTNRKADTEEIAQKRIKYFHSHVEPLVDKAKNFYDVILLKADSSFDHLKIKYNNLIEK